MKKSIRLLKNGFCGVLCLLVAMGGLIPALAQTVVPINGTPPALTPVTINNSPGDQFDPHVSGDWAAYTDNVGIRYYNFATNTDAAIPMGSSANDLLSDVSGSKIVFSRVTIGSGTAVMVFDAATAAAPIEVDPAPATIRFGAAIGGNTVAYIDLGLQANGELVVSDLVTHVSTRITNDTVGDGNPSVAPSGNVVVWEHCTSSFTSCDIYQAVKTGAIWTTSVVSDTLGPASNPDTNETLVVYDSQRGTNSDIFWRSVGGGGETQLEIPGFEGNPSIAGNFIAFESRATVVDAADIFVYDIANNLLYQITNTPLVNEQLNDITRLPNGDLRVVWASDEDGPDQRNIKSATFSLPLIDADSPIGLTFTQIRIRDEDDARIRMRAAFTLAANADINPATENVSLTFSTPAGQFYPAAGSPAMPITPGEFVFKANQSPRCWQLSKAARQRTGIERFEIFEDGFFLFVRPKKNPP